MLQSSVFDYSRSRASIGHDAIESSHHDSKTVERVACGNRPQSYSAVTMIWMLRYMLSKSLQVCWAEGASIAVRSNDSD